MNKIKDIVRNTVMKRKNNPDIQTVNITSKVGYETPECFMNNNKSCKIKLKLCVSNTLNDQGLEKALEDGVNILKKSIKEDYGNKEIINIEILTNPLECGKRNDGISIHYIVAKIKI